MTAKKRFMISYTQADEAWAKWIAWQLEADGHPVFIQAWDILPGQNFVNAMHEAVDDFERIIAVLSPAYMQSTYANPEWQAVFAKDARGRDGLLLPVRVSPVDLKGLLRAIVYVDLVDLDVMSARSALLAAAKQVRGKPTEQPAFPGSAGNNAVAHSAVPEFPGQPGRTVSREPMTAVLRAGDIAALRTFVAEASAAMRRDGFSEDDVEAFRVSSRELVDNVAAHVGRDEAIELLLSYAPQMLNSYHEGVSLEVADGGSGFAFDATLERLERELGNDGTEHGLLRALRRGSLLSQTSALPHVMAWLKERTPDVAPLAFAEELTVPFVVGYRQEALRIGRNVHTFFQFTAFLQRSPQFMNLVFDPLLRPIRKYVGIEIVGEGWTGVLQWRQVLDALLGFAKGHSRFNKQLLLYADTGPAEQNRLRCYCEENSITMFEDKESIALELKLAGQ